MGALAVKRVVNQNPNERSKRAPILAGRCFKLPSKLEP